MKRPSNLTIHEAAGFSMIELLAVLVVLLIIAGFTVFSLAGHQVAYRPDDESLLVTDFFQEARQRSLTQRETMRVEINLTTNRLSLYEENGSTTADDDRLLRTMQLFDPAVVRLGTMPSNITTNPPEPLPVPMAVFKTSVYPPSIGQTVCTFRFLSTGVVTDAGNNAIGSGAIAGGATIPVWSPNLTTNTESDIARAITVVGSIGSIRLWEYDEGMTVTNKWRDSRRFGTY